MDFPWSLHLDFPPASHAQQVSVQQLCLCPRPVLYDRGSSHARNGLGPVVFEGMEPATCVDKTRAERRAGNLLVPTRVARKATLENRHKLLDDFRSWLWECHHVQLSVLLTAKLPDAELSCSWWVAYGQAM